MTQWPALRDILLFAGGLAGVFHETVLATAERPTLLILFAAMMGLPAFLRQDAKGSSTPTIQFPPQQQRSPEEQPQEEQGAAQDSGKEQRGSP